MFKGRNNNFYLFILLFLFSRNNFNCQYKDVRISNCLFNDQDKYSLLNEFCFNNVLMFKDKDYHFAKNTNGDLIVQLHDYSENDELSNSRMFYGLKNDGRYIISNDLYIREFNLDVDENKKNKNNKNFELSNSKILFVAIPNIDQIQNEYLLSINSKNSLVELYDLNNIENNYFTWNFYQFFGLNENDAIGLCDFEIFELKKESKYIIAFIPKNFIDENIKNSIFIKKFRFESFNAGAIKEINSIKFEKYVNKKILSVFLMDDKENALGVLTFETNYRRRNSEIMSPFDGSSLRKLNNHNIFNLIFYINYFEIKRTEINHDQIKDHFREEFLFIKSLYMHDYLTLFIFCNYFQSLYFLLYELNYYELTNLISALEFENNRYQPSGAYSIDESINDLVKLDANRFAFVFIGYFDFNYQVCMRRNLQSLYPKGNELAILIININENIREMEMTEYYINFETLKPTSHISLILYNDYLLLGGSVIIEKSYYETENSLDYLSMFMILGYAEGTDSCIDISKFFYNQDSKLNIFEFLYKNFTIKNNIFNYYPLKAIRFTFIPTEIKIIIHYLKNDETEGNAEEDQEKEDEIISNTPYILCSNNENLAYCDNYYDSEYELLFEQDKSLIKNSLYYYIDYQYILADISECLEYIYYYIDDEILENCFNIFEPKIYYGRINRLKFKLCHDYCETCYELGTSKDDQKCESCLPEYQYDYFYFSNRNEENSNICVPEGYYYNRNESKLYSCNLTEDFFFINTINNKRVCYKKEYNESCPFSYPSYQKIIFSCNDCINNYIFWNELNKYSKKCYNKREKYLDEMIKDFQEYIIDIIDTTPINNGDDFTVITEEMTYALSTTKNQKMKINDNMTSINLGKCETALKINYSIPMNDSLYILKVDTLVNNIQKVEYEVYYNFSKNNLTKLNLIVCKDILLQLM